MAEAKVLDQASTLSSFAGTRASQNEDDDYFVVVENGIGSGF